MVCSYGLVMFATVIFPSFHSMSIVNPPRAFSPFMLPSFQVGGGPGANEYFHYDSAITFPQCRQ